MQTATSGGLCRALSRASLLCALCVATLGLAEQAAAQGAPKCRLVKIVDWPVRIVRNHIAVDGAINGQKVGIILDTGATRSLIMRGAAERLDLPRREATGIRFFGIGGETKVYIATIDDFKLGEVSTKGMQLFVAGERDFGDGVDVLLGEDFLQKFDIEFDLPQKAVRLYQAKDCGDVPLAYWTKEVAGEVAIEAIEEARPRIAFTVQINGKPVDAILDSGAARSFLSTGDANRLGVLPESPGVTAGPVSGGLGGKTLPSWIGPFQTFAIGNESIPDVRIRFGDLYGESTVTSTGSRIAQKVSPTQPMLLGADFLRAHRTFVVHSQRKMYFTYSGGPVF